MCRRLLTCAVLIPFFLALLAPEPAYTRAGEKPAEGTSTLRSKAGAGDIEMTTTSRFAGAIMSLKWNAKEFLDAGQRGGALQSAAHFDCGQEFHGNLYKPTEAGSRRDGEHSTSKLLEFKAQGNELVSRTRMAFWLAPWEKSEGRFARNDETLSDHFLAKRVHLGPTNLPHAIEFEITFTIPKGEFHRGAQFEPLTATMRSEFSEVAAFDHAKGEFAEWKKGQEDRPIALATPDSKFCLGLYSPDKSVVYQLENRAREKTNCWRLASDRRDEKGIAGGDYRFRAFLILGTREDVRRTIKQLRSSDRP